jgi:gas vesicle protein
MNNRFSFKRNSSSAWPYIVAGSAIGGVIGYLFVADSGKRVRHSLTHPDQLRKDFDGARDFVQRTAGGVTHQVHSILNKAKYGIEEAERAYSDAGQHYRAKMQNLERKNNEIASNVHSTVDTVNRGTVDIQRGALDPLCELGALFSGFQRGFKALFGKSRGDRTTSEGPFSFQREKRFPGI